MYSGLRLWTSRMQTLRSSRSVLAVAMSHRAVKERFEQYNKKRKFMNGAQEVKTKNVNQRKEFRELVKKPLIIPKREPTKPE